jgi:serine/threonine protein phosphatase PrpC
MARVPPGETRMIRWLGREHAAPGVVAWSRIELEGSSLEAVISQGNQDPAEKANEDALLVLVPPGPPALPLVLVADAHFGPQAAELAVAAAVRTHAAADWSDLGAPALHELLLRTLRAAQGTILERESASEAAVLVGLVGDDAFIWASVGDAYLYRLQAGRRPRVLNRQARVWLGGRLRVPVREVTELGRCPLEAGEEVLLATDGIPEAVRDDTVLPPSRVEAVLRGAADRRLEALARAALDSGGEDNLAAVLLTLGPAPPRERAAPFSWLSRRLRRGA